MPTVTPHPIEQSHPQEHSDWRLESGRRTAGSIMRMDEQNLISSIAYHGEDCFSSPSTRQCLSIQVTPEVFERFTAAISKLGCSHLGSPRGADGHLRYMRILAAEEALGIEFESRGIRPEQVSLTLVDTHDPAARGGGRIWRAGVAAAA